MSRARAAASRGPGNLLNHRSTPTNATPFRGTREGSDLTLRVASKRACHGSRCRQRGWRRQRSCEEAHGSATMRAGERNHARTPHLAHSGWAVRAKRFHHDPVSGALIEDLDGNHCAVSDCLDPGEHAAGFVLTPPLGLAVDGPLRVDVWPCYYHARMVRSGLRTCALSLLWRPDGLEVLSLGMPPRRPQ